MPDPVGAMFIWPHQWLLVGHLEANRTHRHVAASLLWGLDGPIRVEVEGRWRAFPAALVAPEVPQALDPRDGRVLVAHLDPDSRNWKRLASRLGNGACTRLDPPETLRQQALDLISTAQCTAARGVLETLCCPAGAEPAATDTRVDKVAALLRNAPPEKLHVAVLAAAVGLSPSRLSHLFRAETGVTLRRFLLHLKIRQALSRWRPGMSLSAVAAEAGFHDQPHLARTAREMFDALPSRYIGGELAIHRCLDPGADTTESA